MQQKPVLSSNMRRIESGSLTLCEGTVIKLYVRQTTTFLSVLTKTTQLSSQNKTEVDQYICENYVHNKF